VKRELRKRVLGLRKATPVDACAERSARIVRSVAGLDPVTRARGVALFWPIEDKHEVDLRLLDTELRARGVRVAYPAIVRDAAGLASPGQMTFHFAEPSALEERGYGFAEPPPDAPALSRDLRELDVVVVPALALDPAGQRIGYGAGYYDRALAMTPVVKVGVIFDFQLVSEVPALDGDVAVDWVVTDQRLLRAVRHEEICAPSTGLAPGPPR
jgi:5-formyltetrahydrofolate cyclo-ligase